MRSRRSALRRRLLAWYRANRRDLPWRRTRDPWAILVSEIMLQQTRVDTVEPRYAPFLARFPDAASLAAAPEREVLARWSGLGYYARARNLRKAAESLVREHGGSVPSSWDAVRRLPGIGDYTAGALLSIAYGRPEPAVDGNVLRVLARLLALPGDPRAGSVRRRIEAEARRLVPEDSPGEFNQALMELGARVCVPGVPRCAECPVEPFCEARRHGLAASIPAPRRRPATEEIALAAAVVRDPRGRVFLVPSGSPGRPALVRGLPEPPWIAPPDLRRLEDALSHVHGLRRGGPLSRAGEVRHPILHRRLRVEVWTCSGAGGKGGWVDASDGTPLSSLARKILSVAGALPGAAGLRGAAPAASALSAGARRGSRGRSRGGRAASAR